MDIKALMTKKVAGVPLVWVAAIVAAGLLYMAIRMPRNDAPMEDTEPSDSDAIGGDIADIQQPVFSANSSDYANGVGSSVTVIPTQDTNEIWGRRVTEALLAANYPYNDVAGMVSKYLAGQTLSDAESDLRDIAIRQFGLPPEGVDYAGAAPSEDEEGDEPDKEPIRRGNPPTTHIVAGYLDDTPSELATLYYDVNTVVARGRIQDANPSQSFPADVGTHVVIPTLAPDDVGGETPTTPGSSLQHFTVPTEITNQGLDNWRAGGPAVVPADMQTWNTWNDPHKPIKPPKGDKPDKPPKNHQPDKPKPSTLPNAGPVSQTYKATSATNTAPAIAAKNGLTVAQVKHMNPNVDFPVKPGTKVKV